MKTCIAIVAIALAGCASAPARVPTDVLIMPNDCANREAIARWLETQSLSLANKEYYEQQRSQIRHRLWTLRYNCQPV